MLSMKNEKPRGIDLSTTVFSNPPIDAINPWDEMVLMLNTILRIMSKPVEFIHGRLIN